MSDHDDEPSVMGAGTGLSPMPSRLRWWRYNAEFQLKRLHVCLLCWWYLRHWPMNDLSRAEWQFQLAGETARDAFLEG